MLLIFTKILLKEQNLKPINLLSFVEIFENNNNTIPTYFSSYIGKKYNLEIKNEELYPLIDLVNKHLNNKKYIHFLNSFYIGYKIPQIGKEFDLLRISTTIILNIEFKRTFSDIKKVERQFIKNNYYLKFLGKEVYCFTYNQSADKLYKYNDERKIVEASFTELYRILNKQIETEIVYEQDLNDLFKPSNYLISPFNKVEEFINEEYFLTQEQEDHFLQIQKEIKQGNKKFLILGAAGSGKTLLTYHIASKLIQEKLDVAIIHCAQLNQGQEKLVKNFGWKIVAAKEWQKVFEPGCPDILIIDEAQRIYEHQFNEIIENYVKPKNIILLLSGDIKQILLETEGRIMQNYIDKKTDFITHQLNSKVRTNESVGNFIRIMSDLSLKKSLEFNKEDINIIYFNNINEANSYIESRKEYKYLGYTPHYKHYNEYADTAKLNPRYVGNSHQIIGQEYDNVLVVISENFYYKDNHLYAKKVRNLKFLVNKMFYQQITRVINRLEIVVVKNPEVFNTLISIFDK